MLVLYCLGCVVGKVLPINLFQVSSALQYSLVLVFWLGMAFRLYIPTRLSGKYPRSCCLQSISLCLLRTLSLERWTVPCGRTFQSRFGPLFELLVLPWQSPVLATPSLISDMARRNCHGGGVLLEENCFGACLFHQQIIWIVISLLNVPCMPALALVLVNFSISLVASIGISIVLGYFKVTRFLLGR